MINELFGRLKKDDKDITDSPVSPAQLGGIIDLIASDAISGKIAKDLFESSTPKAAIRPRSSRRGA